MSLILVILIHLTTLDPEHKNQFDYKEDLILEDTINFWHIIINNETVLNANHYYPEEKLEISCTEKLPDYIILNHQTDHGFEHQVDKRIRFYTDDEKFIEEQEIETINFDTKAKIELSEKIKNYESIIIKCEFHLTQRKKEAYEKNEHNYKRIMEMIDSNKEFIVCKLMKK